MSSSFKINGGEYMKTAKTGKKISGLIYLEEIDKTILVKSGSVVNASFNGLSSNDSYNILSAIIDADYQIDIVTPILIPPSPP